MVLWASTALVHLFRRSHVTPTLLALSIVTSKTGTIGAVVPYNLVDPLGEAGGGRKVILPNMAELLAQA